MNEPEQLPLFEYLPTTDGQEHLPNPPGAYSPQTYQTAEQAARRVAEHPYKRVFGPPHLNTQVKADR